MAKQTDSNRPAGARTGAARSTKGRAKTGRRAATPAATRTPRRTESRRKTPEIITTLHNEHGYIGVLLATLERHGKLLGVTGHSADLTMLRDILDYLVSYPGEFHHPREDLIFEQLLIRAPAHSADIEWLTRGHDEIHRISKTLLRKVNGLINGQPIRVNLLKSQLDGFVTGYRDHMKFEEGTIFPLAIEKLHKADWRQIESDSRLVDDPVFGKRVGRQYRRLAGFLGDQASFASDELMAAELFGIQTVIDGMNAVADAGLRAGSSAMRHSADATSENLRLCRTRLLSGEVGKTLGLPVALVSNACRHAADGVIEVRGIVAELGDDLREAATLRLRFLSTRWRQRRGA